MEEDKLKTFWINTLGASWQGELSTFLSSAAMMDISKRIQGERVKYKVYPSSNQVFNAFKATPYNRVRVVFLGEEPNNNGLSCGLAYGIDSKSLTIPYELRELQNEAEKNFNTFSLEFDATLNSWANQGVFLLNVALTSQRRKHKAHVEIWDLFIQEVFKVLQKSPFIIYVLLGDFLKEYEKLITNENHIVIKSNHILEPCVINGDGIRNSKIFSDINNELWIRDLQSVKFI